jgi:hypothetical protein
MMAPVNIYKAGAWHEFIATKKQWLGTAPFVVIVPEQKHKWQIAQAFGDDPLRGVFTIPELVENYARILGKKGLISRHGAETILGAIIAADDAQYLQIEKYKQGYVKALTDFIFDFRRSVMGDLRTALAGFKNEERFTLKETDLVKIDAEYEARLRDYGFDLKSGLEALLQSAPGAIIQKQLGLEPAARLLFFGFDFISQLEEEFIFTVFQNAPAVLWLSCEDSAAPEQAVRVRQSIARLLERAQKRVVEQTVRPADADRFFVTLANTLFRSTPGPAGIEPGVRLFITRENNRLSEVVSMARQIKKLAAAGVSLTAIRIVAPLYDTYGALIQEIFPDYGITFVLEDGIPLLQLPLAALIHNLVIQNVQNNLYRLREKIFASPYVRFTMAIKPGNLVKYQEDAAVTLLSAAQLIQLLPPDVPHQLDFNYIRNLQLKAYRKIKPAPETPQLEVIRQYLEGLEWPDDGARQRSLLQCLSQFYLLRQAERRLYVWQARMSGGEFKMAVLELLDRFQVKANIEFGGCPSPDAAGFRIRERDEAVFRQIETLLDELETSLAWLGPAAAPQLTINELTRLFSRRMEEARWRPATGAGVTVQPAGPGQYQKWDYTFIAGLVDSEFPGTDEFNFLQPQKEGLSLGSPYTSVDYARNYFYHQIRTTDKALFLSLPLSHNGRRLPASPFIREVEKCLAPNHPAEVGPTDSDALYGRREKLLAIGKKADSHYNEVLPLLTALKKSDEKLFAKVTPILRFDGLGLNAAAFSEFDGIFGANAPTLDLLDAAVAKITFTPAVLERYATCPIRFFFDDILQLKAEPDYHPDRTEAGLLIRSVLQKYTETACAAGDVPDDAAVSLNEFAGARLQELFQDHADAFQMRLRKQFLAGLTTPGTGRPGLFAAFLTYEKEAPDLIRPYLANLHGGVTIGDELAVQVAIDRVDLTRAADYCLLFSYTTMDTGNPGKIFRGLRFDLPLMILWFSKYAAENGLPPVAGAGLYLVKNPRNIKRGGYFAIKSVQASRQSTVSDERPIFSGQREGFVAAEDFPVILGRVKNRILRLHRLMRQGVFHLPLCREADQTCLNCSFGRLCRKDQIRLDRLRSRITDRENINIIEEIN